MDKGKPAGLNEMDGFRLRTIVFLAGSTGLLWGLLALPAIAPGLAASLTGPSPKAYWYLARGSALVAFVLLWLSMAMGTTITNRMARLWPGGPQAFELHEFLSLMGLSLAVFHALILLGDRYIDYSLAQVLVPFASANYEPFWVGLGQLGLYAWALVTGTFYMRKLIGSPAWRLFHYLSYLCFGMVLVHGLFSGTDSNNLWVSGLYWSAGGSVFFLLIYRVLNEKAKRLAPQTLARRG